MKNFLRMVFESQDGIGMIMVVGFMALCVPMLTAGLALAGSLSNDSQIKNRIARNQYSSIGVLEYLRYLADAPERWDDWFDETGGSETIAVDDDEAEIIGDSNGTTDDGFLNYCIFGTDSVVVEYNSNIQCSIGSNGNIDIGQGTTVTGDIISGGDIVLGESVLVNGDVLAAGTVTLGPDASVSGIIEEGISFTPITGPTPNYDVTITITDEYGDQTTEITSAEGSNLPLSFSLTAGGPDVLVDTGQERFLDPGSYGDLIMKENGVLELRSGNYAFENLWIQEVSTIHVRADSGPVVLDVVNQLAFQETGVVMNVVGTGDPSDFVVRLQGAAYFKEDVYFVGTYFGFENDIAQMHVKEGATLVGAMYGKDVQVKDSASVVGMPARDVYLSFFDINP